MPRALLLALALALTACADDASSDAPPADDPAEAPMTVEDSAAVLQAQIDSLNALIEGDQQRVAEGFDTLDSLRAEIDETAEGLDETQRRIDALDL